MPFTGVPARETGYQFVHYLRKTITHTDTVAVTVGVLPAHAAVVMGGAFPTTAFNAGTTNDINVGHTGDADAFATLLAVGTIGFKALDELAAATNTIHNAERTVTATYVPTGTAATAGSAEIIIGYVLKP
jgi:hypothetical protein